MKLRVDGVPSGGDSRGRRAVALSPHPLSDAVEVMRSARSAILVASVAGLGYATGPKWARIGNGLLKNLL